MGLTQKLGTIPLAILTDSSNNVGIGAAANASYKLQVTGTTNLTGALSGTSATFSGDLTIDTNTLYVDSTNNRVGIGRTDPTRLLDVSATGAAYIRTSDRTNSVNVDMYSASSGGGIGTQTNHDFILQTNNTQRLLIAASTGAATFSSSITAAGGSLINANNGTLSADILTIRGGGGTGNFGFKVEANNGEDIFYTDNFTYNIIANPLGGKFGIGTIVPSTKLEVNGSGAANSIMTYPCAKFYGGGTGGINIGTDGTYAMIATDTSGADMQFLTRVAGVFYPRITLTSTGNLNFNYNNTGAAYIHINQATGQDGGILFQRNLSNKFQQALSTSGDALIWYNYAAGLENMRLTSIGQLNVNTNGVGANIGVFYNTATSSPFGINVTYTGASPNTSGNDFLYLADASQSKLIIYSNGNVVNRNNSYGPLSDIKLKENIVDASPKLDDLMKVRIVNYNLIADPNLKQIGVIAQELEEIFPGLVEETEDFEQVEIKDEDGNIKREKQSLGTTTKSVKMSVFVPMLIKAMQEQNQLIKDLRNEVEQLKQK